MFERLPYLGPVDMTAFDLEAGLPDSFEGVWPLTVTIMVGRRGDEFGPHLGEVIARGIRREAPEDGGDLGGWESIVADLDGRAFDFYLEASRRRLATYGDDPRAWERIRRDSPDPETVARFWSWAAGMYPFRCVQPRTCSSASATRATWASESAGKNGSATERSATSSVTGNSPGRCPKRSR